MRTLAAQPDFAVARPHPARRRIAAAVAALLMAPLASQALVVIAGTGFTQPGSVVGNDLQWVGNGQYTTGSIDVNAGSTPTFGGLLLGWNQANGSGLIDGAGTTLTLNSVGTGPRLSVGHWGTADLSVTNGAKILADGNATSCNGSCGGVVASFAGTTGVLLVRDAGSEVRLRDTLSLANANIDTVNGFGTVGGSAAATVSILDGGKLYTGGGASGAGNNSRSTEISTARITVSGAGSMWQLDPGSQNQAANRGPNLTLSNSASNETFMSVLAGGELRLNGSGDVFASLAMGTNAGTARLTVSGAGSKVQFNGESTVLQVARSAGSQAQLSVNSAGAVQGLYYLSVGRDGGNGVLQVDGAGSKVSLTGTATVAANGSANVAGLDIGRAAGSLGSATVSNGGLIEVLATTAKSNGPFLNIGRDGGTGLLNITGAGSRVQMSAASLVPGGGASEARNPSVTVGLLGTGQLNISAGGKLLLQGDAVSTSVNSRSTVINVGGNADTGSGGTGVALVTGLGSEMAMAGSDAFIGIGRGVGSTGILTVADQAIVRGQSVAVGRSGGVGTLNLSNGSVFLTGQQTGNNLAGANLSVGAGGGSGVLNMSNNALLRIDNAAGTATTGVAVGGVFGALPGGQGVLTMASGARIEVSGPSGVSGMSVGRDGSGVLSMSAASVDLGSNGAFAVGRNAGSSGVATLTNNSTVTADYVGVGRGRNADLSTFNGGVGALVVNSGSAVTANTIEIGSAGYLGGNGTINGNIVNFGTINPGNSPGTLVINGDYTAAAGGRLVLEVQSDGQGGFAVDQLVFGAGHSLDLSGAVVDFSFLTGTDPNAFLASGQFNIDSFVLQRDAQGNTSAFSDATFAGVTFNAEAADYVINDFSYDPTAGVITLDAVPIPTAVPEPASWALMLAGLLGLAALARRGSQVEANALGQRQRA